MFIPHSARQNVARWNPIFWAVWRSPKQEKLRFFTQCDRQTAHSSMYCFRAAK